MNKNIIKLLFSLFIFPNICLFGMDNNMLKENAKVSLSDGFFQSHAEKFLINFKKFNIKHEYIENEFKRIYEGSSYKILVERIQDLSGNDVVFQVNKFPEIYYHIYSYYIKNINQYKGYIER